MATPPPADKLKIASPDIAGLVLALGLALVRRTFRRR